MHRRQFPYREGTRETVWVGSPSKADKTIPQGREILLRRQQWGDLRTIQGCDLDVLHSPIMEMAFHRILQKHLPGRRLAVFSLCTSTRPYSLSRKWGKFIHFFERYADLIICSNGGIVPIEFEDCYPYLNYDAHGEKKYDDEYVRIGIERLKLFLQTHRYERIVLNFRHNMRNNRIARAVGPWALGEGLIKEFVILPTREQYEAAQREGYREKGFSMFPEIWPGMFLPVLKQLYEWDKLS